MVVVPLRTCVACREQRPQKELVRVSRNSTGGIEVFAPGMKPTAGNFARVGRSAYICPTHDCINGSLKETRKRVPLGYALRMVGSKIDPNLKEKIRAILGGTYDDLSQPRPA